MLLKLVQYNSLIYLLKHLLLSNITKYSSRVTECCSSNQAVPVSLSGKAHEFGLGHSPRLNSEEQQARSM